MFKKKYSYEQRLEESTRIRKAYPERIPVIIERANCSNSDVADLKKHKFLIPSHTTVAQVIGIIRKRVPLLSDDKSIFVFVNDTTMPASAQSLLELYEEHKDKDNFLYITYAGESTFG